MRFTIFDGYGRVVGRACTYDEAGALLVKWHKRRQAACGFTLAFDYTIVDAWVDPEDVS